MKMKVKEGSARTDKLFNCEKQTSTCSSKIWWETEVYRLPYSFFFLCVCVCVWKNLISMMQMTLKLCQQSLHPAR